MKADKYNDKRLIKFMEVFINELQKREGYPAP